MIRVYIAGKLDTKEARDQLEEIDHFCKNKGWSTYLPHRDAGLGTGYNDQEIFKRDKEEVTSCDFIIANMQEIDEGTCWEIGFANVLGIKVFAIGEKRNIMLSFEIEYIKDLNEIEFEKKELISVEGIDGVGKSFYLDKLGFENDDSLSGFGLKLFKALNNKDLFLRSGNTLSEALTLLAIDNTINSKVIDRGIDSIAIYFALQKKDFKEEYFRIYRIAKQIGRVPTKTILLIDNFEKIMQRLEKREGRVLNQEEKEFLRKADNGFKQIAKMFPWRYVVIDLEKGESLNSKHFS
jgi:nucleoside 2-deoxyribosyltransferase